MFLLTVWAVHTKHIENWDQLYITLNRQQFVSYISKWKIIRLLARPLTDLIEISKNSLSVSVKGFFWLLLSQNVIIFPFLWTFKVFFCYKSKMYILKDSINSPTFILTSPACGGATSIVSITSGFFGSQATAARQVIGWN